MSADCGNPNCPEHGMSEAARKDRELRQSIVTNHELMAFVRMLAVNVHASITSHGGIDPRTPLVRDSGLLILKGSDDGNPIVEGIVNGLIVLMRDHVPTQNLAAECRKVPEAENYVTRMEAKNDADHARRLKEAGAIEIPGVGFAIPMNLGGGPGGLDLGDILGKLFGGGPR